MGAVHQSFNIAALLAKVWYQISWPLANDRVVFVIIAIILGVVIANALGRTGGIKRSKVATLLRSVIGLLFGLCISTALVAAAIFTHAADLRWLPKSQQTAPGIPKPQLPKASSSLPIVGDAFNAFVNAVAGALDTTVTHTNSALHPVLMVSVELQAIKVAAGLVVQYGLLAALSGSVLAVMLWIAHLRYKFTVNRRLNSLEQRVSDLGG